MTEPATAEEDLVVRVAGAYVWGLPLVIVHRTCALHGGVGRGMAVRDRLATPSDRTVVAPNNDTLYASGWYDLRAGDLDLEVGAMDTPDRYWSVMLLDAFTEVAYVSRRTHGTAGARVRVTLDPAAGPVVDPSARSSGGPADAAGGPTGPPEVLPLGTPTVWVLARVLVDGPDDLPAARRALASLTVRQSFWRRAARHDDLPAARTEKPQFLGELAAALEVDAPAPWHPAAPEGLDELLADPPAPEVVAAGIARGKAVVAGARGVDRQRDGWGTRSRGAAFGGDVAYRASFAQVSLAGHLPAENRSYSRGFDGSAPAVLRFPPGGEPPVDGFWSLCVYGPDLQFVDNPIDRYSIGDRTPGLRRDADGGLSIVVGADRPAGPEASNWLPTLPGPCFLTLRAYEGRPPVVAAEWFPPALVPLAETEPVS